MIWSLALRGVPVTVGSYRRLCTGFFSRHPVRRLVYPHPEQNEAAFVEWVLKQIRSGAYPVTFGCGETVTYLSPAVHRGVDRRA